jgi:hypothetical protein
MELVPLFRSTRKQVLLPSWMRHDTTLAWICRICAPPPPVTVVVVVVVEVILTAAVVVSTDVRKLKLPAE